MMIRLLLPIALLAACGQDPIVVHGGPADAVRGEWTGAVERFVSAGRTPEAFAELAQTVATLRPHMTAAVAHEAELELVVLALAPVRAVQAKPVADQVALLVLTVMPTLLAPPIDAQDARQAAALVPEPRDDPHRYVERLCSGPLAASCLHAVPELQGELVYARAVQRAAARVRDAVDRCVMCSSDPGWHAAALAWEELDRGANEWSNAVARRADPDNWPLAGAAAGEDPGLAELEGDALGDGAQRVELLREQRGGGTAIALHLRPGTTLAQARAVLRDARNAGCSRVAVIARAPAYPWGRKAYWVTDGQRTGLRPTDSLQRLFDAMDHASRPATVALSE